MAWISVSVLINVRKVCLFSLWAESTGLIATALKSLCVRREMCILMKYAALMMKYFGSLAICQRRRLFTGLRVDTNEAWVWMYRGSVLFPQILSVHLSRLCLRGSDVPTSFRERLYHIIYQGHYAVALLISVKRSKYRIPSLYLDWSPKWAWPKLEAIRNALDKSQTEKCQYCQQDLGILWNNCEICAHLFVIYLLNHFFFCQIKPTKAT